MESLLVFTVDVVCSAAVNVSVVCPRRCVNCFRSDCYISFLVMCMFPKSGIWMTLCPSNPTQRELPAPQHEPLPLFLVVPTLVFGSVCSVVSPMSFFICYVSLCCCLCGCYSGFSFVLDQVICG